MSNRPRKKIDAKKNKREFKPAVKVVAAVMVLILFAVVGAQMLGVFSIGSKTSGTSCDIEDKDLCKFFEVNYERESFAANIKTTNAAGASTAKIETGSGNRSRYLINDGKTDFEYIIINKIIYMKAADGAWWKQVLSSEKQKEYAGKYDYSFEPPDSSLAPSMQIKYQFVRKEWYNRTLNFKYQVIDPNSPGETQFIWFDTKDYLLRRVLKQNPAGNTDVTFAYESVSVEEPASVKVLGPNQFILPGKTEPETVSATP